MILRSAAALRRSPPSATLLRFPPRRAVHTPSAPTPASAPSPTAPPSRAPSDDAEPDPSPPSGGGASAGQLDPRRRRREFLLRFESNDFRLWAVDESVRRARVALSAAGAELTGGVGRLPQKTRRWCVLRGPHVDKKSREHFWMVTKYRIFKAEMDVEEEVREVGIRDAVNRVAMRMPANVAVKVTENAPAILSLPEMWCFAHGLQDPETPAEAGVESAETAGKASEDSEGAKLH